MNMQLQGFCTEASDLHGINIARFIEDICRIPDDVYGYELQALSLSSRLWLETLAYISEKNHSFLIKETPPHHGAMVRQMISYIQEHFAESITIRDLTEHAHVSRSECFRSFHRYTGKKPMEYINEYRLLQAAGHTVHLGGNIGRPLLGEAEAIRPGDWAVVELSSFQLLTMRRSPHIAVLTNLAPNHLDVHTDMEEYVRAKAVLLNYQGPSDRAVCNWDNEITRRLSQETAGKVSHFTRASGFKPDRGCWLEGDAVWYRDEAGAREVLPLRDILLPGVHNVENYMAAICAVQGLVPDGVIRDFARTFGGVEHRIELVRERRGVRWYNDSIASSPSRTMAGLRSFQSKVILIAGGKDKGISYAPLGPVINEHVKLLILCGATAGAIRTAAVEAENYEGLEIHEAADYPAAVTLAAERAGEGDVVILSPASTSFDRFKNFEERGQVFKELVRALPE